MRASMGRISMLALCGLVYRACKSSIVSTAGLWYCKSHTKSSVCRRQDALKSYSIPDNF